jgi:hypothetical protein
MSMDINVYFPSALTTDSLPSIIQRLGELGLRCEFLEDFSFQDTVPITLYLAIGAKEYQEQCFETGFEIALSKFDYAKEIHTGLPSDMLHAPRIQIADRFVALTTMLKEPINEGLCSEHFLSVP